MSYFLAMGVNLAAAVVAASVLPDGFNGLAFTAAAMLGIVIDRLGARFGVSPLAQRSGSSRFVFPIVAAVLIVASAVLEVTVIRPNGALWVAWALAGLILVTFFSGWIADQRDTASSQVRAAAQARPVR